MMYCPICRPIILKQLIVMPLKRIKFNNHVHGFPLKIQYIKVLALTFNLKHTCKMEKDDE